MLLVLLSLFTNSGAVAGPWVHEPGKLYARVGYGLFTAGSAFDDNFKRAPMADDRFLSHMGGVFSKGRFTGHSVSTYAEVGVLPYVEVFGSLPVSFVGNKWTFAKGEAPPILS